MVLGAKNVDVQVVMKPEALDAAMAAGFRKGVARAFDVARDNLSPAKQLEFFGWLRVEAERRISELTTGH